MRNPSDESKTSWLKKLDNAEGICNMSQTNLHTPTTISHSKLLLRINSYRFPSVGNISFHAGELDKKGSFSDAIKGSDSVVVCAFPETPR